MAARTSKSPADFLEDSQWRETPMSRTPKQAISLRLDADVLEHYRSGGPGWQTRINAVLRAYAETKGKGHPS